MRGGAVLCGGHTAVLLLLLLLLTLHTLVLGLAVRAAAGQRGRRRRRRGQVLQLVWHLLHFDHSFSEQVDGVRESGQDELEAFLQDIHAKKDKSKSLRHEFRKNNSPPNVTFCLSKIIKCHPSARKNSPCYSNSSNVQL